MDGDACKELGASSLGRRDVTRIHSSGRNGRWSGLSGGRSAYRSWEGPHRATVPGSVAMSQVMPAYLLKSGLPANHRPRCVQSAQRNSRRRRSHGGSAPRNRLSRDWRVAGCRRHSPRRGAMSKRPAPDIRWDYCLSTVETL